MRTILTPDVLKTMSCDEFEDWRDSGEDYRRELTHAVMRDLSCPENWGMNGEYRSEFGGFFPVQIRFTPSHGQYHLAVCSPGDGAGYQSGTDLCACGDAGRYGGSCL